MKSLVVVVSALGGILLFLLAVASANTSLFAENYPLLLWLNASVAAVLAVLVFVQLRMLRREYRARQFGSRLKLRLMMLFVLMAVLPGAVVYGVSLQFAVRSIESWYNVRVDTALSSGLDLGRSALDALAEQLASRARSAALELSDYSGVPPLPAVSRARDQVGASSALVLAGPGRVLVASSTLAGETLLPEQQPSANQLRQARLSNGLRAVEADGRGGLIMRALVPIPSQRLAAEPLLLQVIAPVPEGLAKSAEGVQALHRDYQELLAARQGLKQLYTLTLTLTLLLTVFAAIAVAFVLARSLSAPLSILAEATQAVAAGDLSPRQALPARDELGVLTQSFNRMILQLQEARAQADNHRAAVEAARTYLESVLANLSAGVLAFTPEGCLRAANRGALESLGDELLGFEEIRLQDWPRHPEFRDAALAGFAEHEESWNRQIELARPDGSHQTLLLHGSRLPQTSGGGLVVVFDDITALISAQRYAAWAEVARRLAHEIKNPLTPIQLSAERLQRKLAERLEEDDRAMLDRCTQTIVNQVEAMKNLVNGFRDYARMPPPEIVSLDLNALIRDVLGLYESARVKVRAELEEPLPQVAGDSTQLRQVIHNLLQNAQDAVAEVASPWVSISTRREGRRVEMLVRDNGPGFAPAMLARAFEPYNTTKSRGSGLGLAIVKKIIDEHRGEIRVANCEDGGAELRVRLRLADPADVTA